MSFFVLKGECCGVSFKYQIWVKSQVMFKITCKFVFDGDHQFLVWAEAIPHFTLKSNYMKWTKAQRDKITP